MTLRSLLTMSALAIAIQGCSTIGDTEFHCKLGEGEDGICMDSMTAYKLAEQGVTTKDIRAASGSDKASDDEKDTDRDDEDKDGKAERGPYSSVAPVVGVMSEPVREPRPILMPPQVMRVSIKQWVDPELPVIHMESRHYIEVTPRRWSFGVEPGINMPELAPFTVVTDEQ